jgi:hypothetical protein
MNLLTLGLIVQLCLIYGMTGIFWPDKLKDCTILWFPFFPTLRMIRHSGVAALLVSVTLFGVLLAQIHQGLT